MATRVPRKPFDSAQLEHVCRVLSDTDRGGLTGSQIGHLLEQIKVVDPDPTGTKWVRLFNALANRQNSDQDADRVLACISVALNPARFVEKLAVYASILESINVILASHGLEFQEDGKYHPVKRAETLTEATRRASKLSESIQNRNLHPELLRYCKAELLADNYFHAVLESCKSISVAIRAITGLTTDGAVLIDEALGGENPRLKINQFQTESEKSEQRGFVNLTKGLLGTFRNPTAHEAKIYWPLTENDALDLFTLASYIHRRLDNRVQ